MGFGYENIVEDADYKVGFLENFQVEERKIIRDKKTGYIQTLLQKVDVVLMCGIPGSGKSTWINQYFFMGTKEKQKDKEQRKNREFSVELFSPDTILVERYNYDWTPQRAQEAWAESYNNFGKKLLQILKKQKNKLPIQHLTIDETEEQTSKDHKMSENKKILIWDATFIHSIQRAAILHMCQGMNLQVAAVFINTPLEICLERNRNRDRDPVPDDRIRGMYSSLLPPSIEEGFDVVFYLGSDT